MQNTSRTEWLNVCAEAAISEDAERLEELIEVINEILRRELQRLRVSHARLHRRYWA